MDKIYKEILSFLDLTQEEEPTSKRFRSDENEDAAKNAPSTKAKINEDSGTSTAAAAAADPSTRPKDGDGIADNLVCSICFDIIHDCVR